MTKKIFQCMDCGKRFRIEVLSPGERQELERLRRPIYPIRCPNCNSGDIIEI